MKTQLVRQFSGKYAIIADGKFLGAEHSLENAWALASHYENAVVTRITKKLLRAKLRGSIAKIFRIINLMDFTPFLTTFSLIALAELGDKTQLAVIALSARYDRKKVFTGVILAFALVTGLGVVVGDMIFKFIPQEWVRIMAGLLFVAFGALILLSKEECEPGETFSIGNPLFSVFSMIALAEMGDKTQLSAITLVAKYDSPYLVFGGALLALCLISLVGIFLGKMLCEIVPLSKIKLGAGLLFILFGLMFLAGTEINPNLFLTILLSFPYIDYLMLIRVY